MSIRPLKFEELAAVAEGKLPNLQSVVHLTYIALQSASTIQERPSEIILNLIKTTLVKFIILSRFIQQIFICAATGP
jgi:hypothetical protein